MRIELSNCLRLLAVCLSAWTGTVVALDPPHDASRSIECMTCHVPHGAPGGSLLRYDGTANLCMSCHNPVGQAAAHSFGVGDQAVPGISGTSHRWDSGPAGRIVPDVTGTASGNIEPGGIYSGAIPKTYSITIVLPGQSGVAQFSWDDGQGNSGIAPTGSDVAISEGLRLRFNDGVTGPSFTTGASWSLVVQPDLRFPDLNVPAERQMAQRVTNLRRLPDRTFDFTYGRITCSVCHDQHDQTHPPFNAPATSLPGDPGRKFQRADNVDAEICFVCHSPRDVDNADAGSHPVRVTIPSATAEDTAKFREPPTFPLTENTGQVVCMTCHSPHFADSGGANGGAGDGFLLRSGIRDACYECHRPASDPDTNGNAFVDRSAGSHFNSGSFLWPGGQYGSTFPAQVGDDKVGACVNCHWPHGWPDDANPGQDYPRLWVERYDTDRTGKTDPDDAEDLCFTCHDGSPAATDIRADFSKGNNGAAIFHHPVADSEQDTGVDRTVECVDCHNPHKARPDHVYAGVDGVDAAGNPVQLGGQSEAADQPLLCFKCHGDTYNAGRDRTSNKRLDFNPDGATPGSDGNSAFHPVLQAGRNQSANLAAQLAPAGLTTSSVIKCTDCHNSNAFANTQGPVDRQAVSATSGPHGSTSAPILRANFSTNYTSEGWNDNNAALCFRCHDRDALLARRRGDGARTNFYGGGKDNLHNYHLSDKGVTSSCLSCHYDIHSNRTADNTLYRWITAQGTFESTTPPAGVKTHLVNFAPDVQALNFALPRWQINTVNGQRQCDLACHGSDDKMDRVNYEPPAGDEPSHTY